jgi:hypothetical protein
MCVFLGYSAMHKGYTCLYCRIGRIYISRAVIFYETVFPFATPGAIIDFTTLLPVHFLAQEPTI